MYYSDSLVQFRIAIHARQKEDKLWNDLGRTQRIDRPKGTSKHLVLGLVPRCSIFFAETINTSKVNSIFIHGSFTFPFWDPLLRIRGDSCTPSLRWYKCRFFFLAERHSPSNNYYLFIA